MSLTKEQEACPHCGSTLSALEIPEGTGWEEPFHLVCFNDECSYFIKGWERMEQEYAQHKSYRYRLNPRTGKSSPFPVWSNNAMRNLIIDKTSD